MHPAQEEEEDSESDDDITWEEGPKIGKNVWLLITGSLLALEPWGLGFKYQTREIQYFLLCVVHMWFLSL